MWSTRLPARPQSISQPSFNSVGEIPVDTAVVVVFSVLCPALAVGDGQWESTETSSTVRPTARKPEKPTPRCSLAGQVCPAVLVETRCAVAGEVASRVANGKR